jgi:hypothetical protein
MGSLTRLHLPCIEAGSSGARGHRDITGVEGRGIEGTQWSAISIGVKSQAAGGRELGAGSRGSGAAVSREAAAASREAAASKEAAPREAAVSREATPR